MLAILVISLLAWWLLIGMVAIAELPVAVRRTSAAPFALLSLRAAWIFPPATLAYYAVSKRGMRAAPAGEPPRLTERR
jgi:hypothetical protein